MATDDGIGPLSPRIEPREVVYQNAYQQVYRVRADFGSFHKEYFVTDYGPRAALLAVRGNSVLLVRQYRLLIDRVSWEVPGGKVDEGETPESAAVRECLEESGVLCRGLRPLAFFHPGLDTLHNPTHVFVSDACEDVGPRGPHGHEIHGQAWVPLDRCRAMICSGEIVDSLSILALFSFLLNARMGAGQENW